MKVKFSRCSSSNLTNVPQVDGQLIYTKDTGEVYLDVGNSRKKISDVIEIESKSSVQTPITSKLYYDNSTDILYKVKQDGNEFIWIDITGATVEYVQNQIQALTTYIDNNYLKKDNTDEFIPSGNYNPATKKYVDDNAVTFKPFPNEFNINGTTQQFFTSVRNVAPAKGMAFLGLVRLSDMPEGLSQAEVELYVYNNNVYYCTMRSADLSPYKWECNSYQYRGWEAPASAVETSFDNTGTEIEATNVEDAIKEINNKVDGISETLDQANELATEILGM